MHEILADNAHAHSTTSLVIGIVVVVLLAIVALIWANK